MKCNVSEYPNPSQDVYNTFCLVTVGDIKTDPVEFSFRFSLQVDRHERTWHIDGKVESYRWISKYTIDDCNEINYVLDAESEYVGALKDYLKAKLPDLVVLSGTIASPLRQAYSAQQGYII